MHTVKIVARALFWFSRMLAILYLALTALSLIALTTGYGLRLAENQSKFQVLLPFTQQSILLGDYNAAYILNYFLAPVALYGCFFWLLGNVFRVFYQQRLFTIQGVRQLRIFYLANFIVPLLVLFLHSFFVEVEEETMVLTVLHLTIGVFAYFLAAIFRQGLQLQNEQDLYI